MKETKPPMMSAAEAILADVQARERLSPNHYYAAKKPSIRLAREAGFTDAEIEALYGITLKPEDKTA
jgi:hypothetical protein